MSKILAVDDDSAVLALVSHRLTAGGHRVLTAADGPQALAVVDERGLPDVAVLDVSMPGMTGLELAEALRAREGGEDVVLVFLSARVQPEDIAAGQSLGALYLTKPFVASALLATIERATAQAAVGW